MCRRQIEHGVVGRREDERGHGSARRSAWPSPCVGARGRSRRGRDPWQINARKKRKRQIAHGVRFVGEGCSQPIPSVQVANPFCAGSLLHKGGQSFCRQVLPICRQICIDLASNIMCNGGKFQRRTGARVSALGRRRLRPRAETPRASGKMPPAHLPTARRAGAAARNKETEGKEKEEPSPHTPYKKKEKRKGKKV